MLPVLLHILLPVLKLCVLLLSPLLHSDALVEEVTGAPDKELALLAPSALWHPLAGVLLMLLFMRELAWLLVAPALYVKSAWCV